MYRQYKAKSSNVWYSIFEPPFTDTGEYLGIIWNSKGNLWASTSVHWDRNSVRPKDPTSGWTIHGYSGEDWRVVAWGLIHVPDKVVSTFPKPAVGDWDDWAEQ